MPGLVRGTPMDCTGSFCALSACDVRAASSWERESTASTMVSKLGIKASEGSGCCISVKLSSHRCEVSKEFTGSRATCLCSTWKSHSKMVAS